MVAFRAVPDSIHNFPAAAPEDAALPEPSRHHAWPRSRSARAILALLALALGLLATAYTALQVKASIDKNAADEFAFACDQITLKIEERLGAYALLLRGCQGLFAASDDVSRAEWRAYTQAVQAGDPAPGYQGIGFSLQIPQDDLAAHVAKIRSQGFPDYKIQPPGERDSYSSIIYLEPFAERNLRAFGYDMFSEPVRRNAMERARDTGEPALSGKVKLMQEGDKEVQFGTLMYVPVYRRGAPLENAADRRAALIGWVYSPYRMNDLIKGILGEWDIRPGSLPRTRIYDGGEPFPSNLIFDSAPDGPNEADPLFHQERMIDFNGTLWLLVFTGNPSSEPADHTPAVVTLLAGLIISGLIVGLMLVIYKRSDAVEMAEDLAARIRDMAFHDSLTGLPNRRLLHDRMEMALAANRRIGRHGALLMIDLDNFKPLNDEHGHAAGDQLLVEVARRLHRCVRETDTVARLGGDEFVVLLANLDESRASAAEQAAAVADKIRAALERPYFVAAGPAGGATVRHFCSSSIGVALFGPADTDQHKVIHRADDAMYDAKQAGRNRVVMARSDEPAAAEAPVPFKA